MDYERLGIAAKMLDGDPVPKLVSDHFVEWAIL
jgi:hypothetical protein